MASQPTRGGPSGLPLTLIAQALPRLTRHDLEALTERLIEALDEQDGDLDLEPNGDELDGSMGEDDFNPQNCPGHLIGPGCPLADPDMAADDINCDEPDQDREPDEYADEFADPIARAEQRQRIRQSWCGKVRSPYTIGGQREIIGHQLFIEPRAPTKRQLLRRKRGVPRLPRP